MARKESLDIMHAFKRGLTKHMARTSTDGNRVYLFGHTIIQRTQTGYKLYLHGDKNPKQLCPSATTLERLNTFFYVNDFPIKLYVRQGVPHISYNYDGKTKIESVDPCAMIALENGEIIF